LPTQKSGCGSLEEGIKRDALLTSAMPHGDSSQDGGEIAHSPKTNVE
jgi:hypothetical protein